MLPFPPTQQKGKKVVWALDGCSLFLLLLGQANWINYFSSPPTTLFTPSPLDSLLLLSITCACTLMLRRLAII